MQSKATTVTDYLASLPEDRRKVISAVRKVLLQNLDKDFTEGMQYGMIGYYVPHSIYPPGYHCDPKQGLPFGGLASQKNYMSLYLMCLYINSAELKKLEQACKKAGRKLDMGKCCIRFKTLDDLPVEIIGEIVKGVSVKKYIEYYESAIRTNQKAKAKRQAAKKKPAKGK